MQTLVRLTRVVPSFMGQTRNGGNYL